MNKRVFLLTACLAMLTLGVQAQSSNEQRSAKSEALVRQARSDDRLQKIDLLRSFQNGSLKVDDDSIRALSLLAGMGTVWRDYTSMSNDFADIRAGALLVLADSGRDEARTIILQSVDQETHPMVLVAGFEAITQLGAGDDMMSIRVLNDAMLRNMARSRENSVADEYLKAIEALADRSNPDMQTIEVLTSLGQGHGFSFNIRSRATELLKSFW